MPRIRSIKPEFPQSETIGRLSRDARLLFIQLWTIVDDDGRTRAASRMLASLLYPYDDDAPRLIDTWLGELEAADCIRRYQVEGSVYLEVVNWLKHQKIDRPTKSRLPAFDEGSPLPREGSRALDADLGPRTLDLDQDLGEDHSDLRSAAIAAPEVGGEIPEFLKRDPRAELFDRGLSKLAAITGKTPDSCRSLVGKWLKAVNDEAIHVLGAIDDAERNRIADPVPWIMRKLQPYTGDRHGKRTVHDAARDQLERVRALDEGPPDLRDGAGKSPVRLLQAR